MQLTSKEARKIIDKVGAELKHCKHHIRGFVVTKDKRLFPVHCSFGNKEMPEAVVHRFRRSLRVSVDEFRVLKSCKMKRREYLQRVSRR